MSKKTFFLFRTFDLFVLQFFVLNVWFFSLTTSFYTTICGALETFGLLFSVRSVETFRFGFFLVFIFLFCFSLFEQIFYRQQLRTVFSPFVFFIYAFFPSASRLDSMVEQNFLNKVFFVSISFLSFSLFALRLVPFFSERVLLETRKISNDSKSKQISPEE